MHYTEPELERPFRVPINIGKFPVLPLIGLGTIVYMTLQFDIEIMLVGIAIIGIGAVFYFILRRNKKITNSN